MKQSKFPPGWDEQRVRRVLEHYEQQTDEQAVAEDEATFEDATQTVMGGEKVSGTFLLIKDLAVYPVLLV